jgi:hypothetical protein
MKKLSLMFAVFAFAFVTYTAQAQAGCGDEIKKAADAAKKDKQCQKDATNLFRAFGNQWGTCKNHRKNLKACRKAKRAAKKDCRKLKGKAERECKKNAREAKRACKDDARDQAAFAVCKDARKLTAKAAGTALKCAAKHFKTAASVCASELAQSLGN